MEYKRPWLKDSGITFKTSDNNLQKISSTLCVNLHKNRTIEPFKKEYCVHKAKVTRTISIHCNDGITESKEFSLSLQHTEEKRFQPIEIKRSDTFYNYNCSSSVEPGPLWISWEHLWKNCPNEKITILIIILVQIGTVLTTLAFHFVKTLCVKLLMELLNFTWELTPEYLSSEEKEYMDWKLDICHTVADLY